VDSLLSQMVITVFIAQLVRTVPILLVLGQENNGPESFESRYLKKIGDAGFLPGDLEKRCLANLTIPAFDRNFLF